MGIASTLLKVLLALKVGKTKHTSETFQMEFSCPFHVPFRSLGSRAGSVSKLKSSVTCATAFHTDTGLTNDQQGKVYMCQLGCHRKVQRQTKDTAKQETLWDISKEYYFLDLFSRWWLKLVFEYPKENHISKSFQHLPLVHQVLKETHCVQCYLQLWKTRLCVLSEEWNLHFLASYAAYHPVFPSVSSSGSCVRFACIFSRLPVQHQRRNTISPPHWARQNQNALLF